MSQLFVISQRDLLESGCPHCGCIEGGVFLSFGTCSLWACEVCLIESAVVAESIKEVFQIRINNTDILDLIGKHPYKHNRIFDDRMPETKKLFLKFSVVELFTD